MRISLLTKSFVITLLTLGVFFWQTHGAANLHASTMDSDMATTECTTTLPCLTAVHVSPVPFILIASILLLATLLSFNLVIAFTNASLERFRLYTKNIRLRIGSPNLFDYLQQFLAKGILQLKIADASTN